MGLEVQIKGITKDNIRQLLPSLLSLEPHWVAIGDKAWTADSFEKDLPAKWELSKYASVDGKVVGYFIASVDGEVGKLNKVLVNPDFRGQGIGDMLWEEFLDGCRKHSVERAEFKVLPGNPSAARLYRSKGCLFAGQALGSDGLLRDNIIYPFRLEERISHSRPVITSDDKEAVMRAIDNGDLVTGNFVNSLVDQFSRYIGRKYGIATSSGTAALHLALRALDVKQGDEVILPSYVCNAVLNAVKYCDATPVLVDINPDDYNISLEDTKKSVLGTTKAIIIPHMFGDSVKNLEDFIALDVPVIEDCALSVGASIDGKKVGSFGDLSIFSFRATKMMAAGLGGMVLTDDKSLYDRLKDLTTYDNREHAGESYNYQMSDINAALALNQLRKLDTFVWARKIIASKYSEMFSKSEVDFEFPKVDENLIVSNENIFFRYVIRHPEAENLINNVRSRGVDVARPVFMPLHRYLKLEDSYFPNTVKAFNTAVSIPIYPSLTEGVPTLEDKNLQRVAGTLLNWKYEKGGLK